MGARKHGLASDLSTQGPGVGLIDIGFGSWPVAVPRITADNGPITFTHPDDLDPRPVYGPPEPIHNLCRCAMCDWS